MSGDIGSIYHCNMDEGTLQKAIKEIGENPVDRMAALKTFNDWIHKQRGWLRTPKDQNFLMSFLRLKKFSQLGARKALVDYWRSRMERPPWFHNVDTADPVIRTVIKSGALVVLPGKDRHGRTVLLGRPGAVDHTGGSFSADDLFRGAFVVADYLLRDENTQVNGFVSITDFSHFGLKHTNFKGTGNIRENAAIWSKVYPIRVKEIHHYNMGKFGEFAFTLSRPFLPEKVQKRIFNHSNLLTLYDHIDQSMLPEEYLPDDYNGPNAGSIDNLTDNLLGELTKPDTRSYIQMLSSSDYGVIREKQPPPDEVNMPSYRKLED